MIGKISIGKGFGGCLSYCLSDKEKEKEKEKEKNLPHRAEVLHYNQCFGNVHQLIRQFNEVRQLNRRIKKPVWHTSLSFADGDNVTLLDKIDIANRFAEKFGFQDNQYVAIQHNDTPNHEHIHIVANRVGYDGKVVTDSKNFKRMAEFCREIERDFKLTIVQSPEKFLPPQERNLSRKDSRKDNIKKCVGAVLDDSSSIPEFTSKLNELGYKVEIGRGIAFIDNKKVRVKGSQIGYSLNLIKIQLSKNLENQLLPSMDRGRSLNLSI